jgi:hypothetical protein
MTSAGACRALPPGSAACKQMESQATGPAKNPRDDDNDDQPADQRTSPSRESRKPPPPPQPPSHREIFAHNNLKNSIGFITLPIRTSLTPNHHPSIPPLQRHKRKTAQLNQAKFSSPIPPAPRPTPTSPQKPWPRPRHLRRQPLPRRLRRGGPSRVPSAKPSSMRRCVGFYQLSHPVIQPCNLCQYRCQHT